TFTTRRPSAEPEDPSSPSQGRRIHAPTEFRKSPRTTVSPKISPSRTESAVRSPRQGPVAVAGRASTPHASPVRTVAVPRIVDAAAHLRPETVTRLRLALHPEPLG